LKGTDEVSEMGWIEGDVALGWIEGGWIEGDVALGWIEGDVALDSDWNDRWRWMA
jgi:hypothetical protein